MTSPRVIRIVLVRPGQRAEVHIVPNTLPVLRELVGGELELLPVRMLRPFGALGLHVYVNEDGVRLGLPANFESETRTGELITYAEPPLLLLGDRARRAADKVVLGPAIVSAADAEGNEIGLDESQAAFAIAYFDGRFAGSGIRPRLLESRDNDL